MNGINDWKKYHSRSQNIGCWTSQSRNKTYPAPSRHQQKLYDAGWVVLGEEHKHPITGKPQYLNVFTNALCHDITKLPDYVPKSSSLIQQQPPPVAATATTTTTTSSDIKMAPPPPIPSFPSSTTNTTNTNSNSSLGKRPREITADDDQGQAKGFYNRLDRSREDRKKGSAAKMRARHNWIKNVLISKTISKVKSPNNNICVLELSCGKGGDFFKIKNACPNGSTLNYVGVDIADVSLKEVVKRISEQKGRNNRGAFKTNVRLSCVDLGKDDMVGHTSTHLSSWSQEKGWHNGPALNSNDLFDVVTMQFALHYMFQSSSRLKQFFVSWSKHLKDGGRFIATTMDSDVVLEHIFTQPNKNPVTICDSQNRPCCTMLIDRNVHETIMKRIGYDSNFQLRYQMTLTEYDENNGSPTNYVEAPEWIVIMSNLVDYAWRYGNLFLEFDESLNFHHFFQKYANDEDYNHLLSKMKVIDNNAKSGGRSSGSGGGSSSSSSSSRAAAFTKIEWDLTRLYRTLSFVKGNGGRRVAIIVPFRDEHASQKRSEHLAQFMSYMLGYMSKSLVPFHIYIIEQSSNDGRKFNRGKLLNIGYQIAEKEGKCTAFIFHDVDLLPSNELLKHYRCQEKELELMPNHIARVWSRYNANPNYIGGVTAYSKTCFEQLNGFPNNFWGWGGEDDELQNRMKACKQKFRSPKHGTLTDLENMTLAEKLSFLKEQNIDRGSIKGTDNHWKCMVKTDLLKEHSSTWRTNGLRDSSGRDSILYDDRKDRIHASSYSTKITVHLTNNGDKYDTITSWKDL
jgi:hypothetical protein